MKIFKSLSLIVLAAILITSCAKEYSSEHKRAATGSWQFSNGNLNYSGFIDSVYQTKGIGSHRLSISGKSYDGSHLFALNLYGDTFPPGAYKASLFQCTFSYSILGKTIYQASQLTGEFIVNLNTIDSTNISGTFSGTAIDSSNNIIQISSGKFVTE